MARARNIKPGFFRNAELVELPVETRLLFPGLWVIADREGRLEDRPKQIKMEIFPADSFDVDCMLGQLSNAGLIIRYEVNGKRLIQIVNFLKHQNPHKDERASILPPCDENEAEHKETPCKPSASTVQTPCKPSASAEVVRLIPDSLLLIPDSPKPKSTPKSKPLQPASPTAPQKKMNGSAHPDETALQACCRETWHGYGLAYAERYGTPPVRNAKINANVKAFCQRVPEAEAPGIAAFFVRHNLAFYVQKGHAFGLLLADAEKLRTEWVTQKTITQTEARQADRTQAGGNVWSEVINEIKEKELANAIN